MLRSALLFSVMGLALLVSCTKNSNSSKSVEGSAGKGGEFRVGLVLDKGGKDDKSFNQAAFTGATQAVRELGVELKEVESPDDAAFEPALRTFAERGYGVVLAIGFSQMDAVAKVAAQFPKTHFALIDAKVDLPNVASHMFAEHEGSYLAGYLAALASKSGKIGFIGGMDIPLIRRFQMGYEAGAKAANPKVQLLVNYVGNTGTAWKDPNRAKELALGQYAKGVDIIFGAAGASNMGMFDAAEEKKLFAIGVDSNQNYIKPGRVLTSMLKRVDVAVFEAIKAAKEGQFKAGLRTFGLADKGIDLAVDEHNQALVAPYQAQLQVTREKIMSGAIKVPDYYEVSKAK